MLELPDKKVTPTENIVRLGIKLPALSPTSGSYIHATRSGNLLFLAGKGVGSYRGKVGREVTLDQAQEFARSTTLAILAVVEKELGSLDHVSKFLKLNGYVNSTPEFSEHPKVMDACSDLLCDIFGDAASHARTSVGVAATPDQIPVEIEAILEIENGTKG